MARLASLRSYVEALRKIGEVNEVDREVDWDLEMGLITRRCYETGAPAPQFTNVKDSPGFRALGAAHGESSKPGQRLARIALAVGLEPDATAREIIDHLVAVRQHDLIPPTIVETGPCKENVLLGDAVDLTMLPSPIPHNGDGGRYLNTLGVIVCRTPDGSWTGWSVNRVMLLDKNKGVGVVAPFQHLGKIHAEWRKIGKDMPFAIALGVEPAALYSAGGPLIGADVGAMTSPSQIDIVDAHVRDAVAKGARVLTGGRRADRPGTWYEPTVLADVDHAMKVMVEETFGPVLPIMKVTDAAEAVRLANDSEFGLAATVFAGSVRYGERIARAIDSGTVNVDDYAISAMCIDVPMGGWKRSGIGQRSADHGLLKFTRQKTISAPRMLTLPSEPWWFPYTPLKVGLVQKVMRFVNAPGPARLGAPARRKEGT